MSGLICTLSETGPIKCSIMCYFYCGLASRFPSLSVFFSFPFLSSCAGQNLRLIHLFIFLSEKPEISISPVVWRAHPLQNQLHRKSRSNQPQSCCNRKLKNIKGPTTATLEITRRPSDGRSGVAGAVSVQEMKNKNKTQHRGDLLLKVTVLHIAKEALQFRYSTYQQFD